MKKIITILVLLICCYDLFAQQSTPDSAKFIWYKYQYGIRQPRAQSDTLQDIPKDTAYSKYGIARKGSRFFVGNGSYWTEIVAGTSISTINVITDSSISICNFNSCDTFYTSVQTQFVTILNDSTVLVCDTTACDTLHIPRTQFFQSMWDSTTVYNTINDLRSYIYDTSFTNQFMPNGVKMDTVYDVSDSIMNRLRFQFSDNRTNPPTITTWDYEFQLSLNQTNITSIQNIINYIDSAFTTSDTTFHVSDSLNGVPIVTIDFDPLSPNDTVRYHFNGVGHAGQFLTTDGTNSRTHLSWGTAGSVQVTADSTLTATGGQTAFTFASVPASYSDYEIHVNGQKWDQTTGFTTSGNVITLTTPLSAGDLVNYSRKK